MKYEVLEGKVTVVNDCVMLHSLIRVYYYKTLYVDMKFWCAIADEPVFQKQRSMVQLVKNNSDVDIIATHDKLMSGTQFVLSLEREELFYHTKDYLFLEILEKTFHLEELEEYRLLLLPI